MVIKSKHVPGKISLAMCINFLFTRVRYKDPNPFVA